MHLVRKNELAQAQLFARQPAEPPVPRLSPLELALLRALGNPQTLAELELVLGRGDGHVAGAVAWLRRRRLIEPLHEYEIAPRDTVIYTRSQFGGIVLRSQELDA